MAVVMMNTTPTPHVPVKQPAKEWEWDFWGKNKPKKDDTLSSTVNVALAVCTAVSVMDYFKGLDK